MKLNSNKKSVKFLAACSCCTTVLVCGIVFALPAFAASDPLVVVENLSTFIFSLTARWGYPAGWGIVQVGLSLQSHDPSQRSQGFRDAGGWSGDYLRQRNPRPHYRVRVIPRGRTVMSCG